MSLLDQNFCCVIVMLAMLDLAGFSLPCVLAISSIEMSKREVARFHALTFLHFGVASPLEMKQYKNVIMLA